MKLEIDGLTKMYGQQKVIASLSLNLPSCQTLVLLGPSGGGKSTLLRLIAGLETPDSGWISLNGQRIDYREKALIEYRKSLGIVFQSWNLFPHLTALENIVLPLYKVHGLSLEEARARSIDLLKRFELDNHAHKKPHMLSGGQVQRIALIRAVAIQPKMLVLDEPTSALDPLMTSEVLELIIELKKEKQDLLLVTHHLLFARQIADWIIFINEGLMLESGPCSAIFDHPKEILVQQYMSKILNY